MDTPASPSETARDLAAMQQHLDATVRGLFRLEAAAGGRDVQALTPLDGLLALHQAPLRLAAPVEAGEMLRALLTAMHCLDALDDALGMSAEIARTREPGENT